MVEFRVEAASYSKIPKFIKLLISRGISVSSNQRSDGLFLQVDETQSAELLRLAQHNRISLSIN